MPFRSYAGIGARETPTEVLQWMTRIAGYFDDLGWCLRSGGAQGADQAFLNGSVKRHEIYLPWNGFRSFKIDNQRFFGFTPEATEIAKLHHPKWNQLAPAGRKFHSRNVHQVLGRDLTQPSEMVIAWTKDGEASGGTGQAIRIAEKYDKRKIFVFNLKKPLATLPQFIRELN